MQMQMNDQIYKSTLSAFYPESLVCGKLWQNLIKHVTIAGQIMTNEAIQAK